MAQYICEICKILSDNEQSMTIYHCLSCDKCCQSRKELQNSHCNKCQCCRSKTHTCIEGVLHRDCPICFENLSQARATFTSLPCGHMIHHGCFLKLTRNICPFPFCSKKFSYMPERNTTWRLQLHRFLSVFNTKC
ncbi:uncharacterized protein LOC141706217 [Apium graveolens]|uniref:uncharacterized protein LOC141706217 n=1 Tax=Apium graveolens TaxID=4045 RepID=UPI003D7929F9